LAGKPLLGLSRLEKPQKTVKKAENLDYIVITKPPNSSKSQVVFAGPEVGYSCSYFHILERKYS
jgi:hypothetical protein